MGAYGNQNQIRSDQSPQDDSRDGEARNGQACSQGEAGDEGRQGQGLLKARRKAFAEAEQLALSLSVEPGRLVQSSFPWRLLEERRERQRGCRKKRRE